MAAHPVCYQEPNVKSNHVIEILVLVEKEIVVPLDCLVLKQ
jgi:hypothetical protein